MLIVQKLKTLKFTDKDYKKSYLKAAKFAAKFIKNSKRNLFFAYEKEKDFRSILLNIYFSYNDNDLANHRCMVCKEFHKSFFFSDEANCNNCKMSAYRKELDTESKRIAKLVKSELQLDDKEPNNKGTFETELGEDNEEIPNF